MTAVVPLSLPGDYLASFSMSLREGSRDSPRTGVRMGKSMVPLNRLS
jgi:hypothetical protein